MFHQHLDIGLGAAQVVAGFVVALFRQGRQCEQAQVLDQLVLGHASAHLGVEKGVLVGQPVARVLELNLCMDPRQQQRRFDRLGHVIDGAQRQAMLLVVVGVQRRHEDHRDVVQIGLRAQGLQHLVAVDHRHHHVQQDQVGTRLGAHRLQGAQAGIGHAHMVERPQDLADGGQVFLGVVDQQHGGAGSGQRVEAGRRVHV